MQRLKPGPLPYVLRWPEGKPGDQLKAQVHSAFRALSQGEASPEQQRMAVEFMVYDLCGRYDQPYRPGPDGDRDTAFACGRLWVGQQITTFVNLSPSRFVDSSGEDS